jgi:hypothetical protein
MMAIRYSGCYQIDASVTSYRKVVNENIVLRGLAETLLRSDSESIGGRDLKWFERTDEDTRSIVIRRE